MATTTTYAQLNIGRNIGTDPMSDAQWQGFINDCILALSVAADTTNTDVTYSVAGDVQVHYGKGDWIGMVEESAHLSLFWDKGIDVDNLTSMLPRIAANHEQDAIAVVTGSTLVAADAPAPAPLPAPVSARRHVANRPALIPA